MKTITVNMTDEVYRDILDNVGLRRMLGEGHGIMDTAITKIILSMRDGDENVWLSYKKDKDE